MDVVLKTGKQVLKYRIDNNLSQERFAEIIGKSRNTVASWEKRNTKLDKETVRLLTIVLNPPRPDYWVEEPKKQGFWKTIFNFLKGKKNDC